VEIMQAKVKQRIDKMRQESAALSTQQLDQREAALARQAQQMEAARDLSKVFLHVDMDAFFASVEELDDPKLRLVPMAGVPHCSFWHAASCPCGL
jgi:DNA polymerase kappa